MDDGMQWLVGTVLSAVISSVMTVGFLSALVTRLQIRIDHRNNGIKRVYAPGEHSRTLKKQLAEARAIQLLALSGYGFTHAYRRILTDCVARGGTVEYLLAQPGTAYMKDAAEIEGRGADSISEEVGETLKLLEAIRAFRAEHPVPQEAQGRLIRPKLLYYGREMWQAAATALLCGENLLLSGPKATGKNVLAENLAAAFGRPVWNVSMYVNIDAASLIGADTLKEGEVVFREGPVCQCARLGGFGVLDEVNMAKNEALAVLHAALDFRRVMDVPGYRPVPLDEAARFIGTMNYGYAGTRELNEALVSRFAVVDMPVIAQEDLEKLLRRAFPQLKNKWVGQFAALFQDLRDKCQSGEISTRTLDLRGLLAALRLIGHGLAAGQALELGLVNKAFDPYERQLAADVIAARIPREAGRDQLMEG